MLKVIVYWKTGTVPPKSKYGRPFTEYNAVRVMPTDNFLWIIEDEGVVKSGQNKVNTIKKATSIAVDEVYAWTQELQ